MSRDVLAVAERVLAGDGDVTRQHEPRRSGELAEVNDDFIRAESPRRAAKALRDLDLRRRELREHLLAALLENGGRGKRHHASPAGVDSAAQL